MNQDEWMRKQSDESNNEQQWLYGGVIQPQEQGHAREEEQLIVQFPTEEGKVPQQMQPQQPMQEQPIQLQPVYQKQACPQGMPMQSQFTMQHQGMPMPQQPMPIQPQMIQSQPMYQQQPQMMQSQPMYQSQPRPMVKKKAAPISHSKLALISMILGIASLLLFACGVNYSLLIGAIILGIIHLVKRGKPAMAIVGIVTAVLSFLLGTLMWIAVVRVQLVDVFNNSNPNDGYYDYFDDNFGPDFEDMEGGNQML